MFTRFSVSRAALLSRAGFLLAAGAALCAAPQAHAQVYLVGAELFAADANGATTSQSYQYDTNFHSGGVTPLDITFNGATVKKGISFALGSGSNTFTFAEDSVTPISNYGGSDGDLGLFFSSTSPSYNPTSGARIPDLLVARATNGASSFFTPVAGTQINDYVFSALTTYGGAASFMVGTSRITVSNYSVSDSGSGTFTLGPPSPAVTPEPGSIAMLIGLTTTGAGFLARRRRKVSKAA